MHYVTSLEEVLWGITLVAITMAIHGFGMLLARCSRATRSKRRLAERSPFSRESPCSFNLPLRWRLLDGMIPIAGLMTFAWSTGVLFTLAQEFQSRQLASIHQQRAARRARRQSRRMD